MTRLIAGQPARFPARPGWPTSLPESVSWQEGSGLLLSSCQHARLHHTSLRSTGYADRTHAAEHPGVGC